MTLHESIDRILAEGTKLTDRFYELFLERHPEARALFDKKHMSTQSVMLSVALMVNKHSPDHPQGTRHYLNVLGTRHARKGVSRDLYPAFQEIFLEALEEFHGQDWTEELSREWREANEKAVQLMFEGYDQRSRV